MVWVVRLFLSLMMSCWLFWLKNSVFWLLMCGNVYWCVFVVGCVCVGGVVCMNGLCRSFVCVVGGGSGSMILILIWLGCCIFVSSCVGLCLSGLSILMKGLGVSVCICGLFMNYSLCLVLCSFLWLVVSFMSGVFRLMWLWLLSRSCFCFGVIVLCRMFGFCVMF